MASIFANYPVTPKPKIPVMTGGGGQDPYSPSVMGGRGAGILSTYLASQEAQKQYGQNLSSIGGQMENIYKDRIGMVDQMGEQAYKDIERSGAAMYGQDASRIIGSGGYGTTLMTGAKTASYDYMGRMKGQLKEMLLQAKLGTMSDYADYLRWKATSPIPQYEAYAAADQKSGWTKNRYGVYEMTNPGKYSA